MKMLAVLALASVMTGAFASEEFGGIKLHTTVEPHQASAIKNDLKYLYKNPVTTPDQEFLKIANMQVGDGSNMHNWLLNRIRYVVGERFDFSGKNMVAYRGNFPSTPMVEFEEAPEVDKPTTKAGNAPVSEVKTIMSNMGGALYIEGKAQNIFFGIKFDNEVVVATSTRVGLLQVGEGMFMPGFMLNKDINHPANSVFRLSTLFHEARHSDGNSKHTGFIHKYCPKGHPYAGYAACEVSANGSYTIGALATRQLLNSCTACSTQEITALKSQVIDSFSRIIKIDVATKSAELQKKINVNKNILTTFENLLNQNIPGVQTVNLKLEIQNLKKLIAQDQAELDALKRANGKPLMLDPNAEGQYKTVSLKDSMSAMEKSLK